MRHLNRKGLLGRELDLSDTINSRDNKAVAFYAWENRNELGCRLVGVCLEKKQVEAVVKWLNRWLKERKP